MSSWASESTRLIENMQAQTSNNADSTKVTLAAVSTESVAKPKLRGLRRVLDPSIYPEVTICRAAFFAIWVIPHVIILSYYSTRGSKSLKKAFNKGVMSSILFDTAIILILMSPTFIMLLRRTFVSQLITLEKNVHAHKVAAYTLVFMSAVHTGIYYDEYIKKAQTKQKNGKSVPGTPLINNMFYKMTGWTGHVLLFSLFLIIVTSIKPIRRRLFEIFYFVHQLFVVFVAILFIHHKNRMAYKYLSGPLALYSLDRLYRAVRSTFAKSPIRAVVQHPSGVVELQLDKRIFKHRVGQYVKVYCPAVSPVQWHPMTISSAPEEDMLTIHFRLSGGWTHKLARRLGCNFDNNSRNSVLQQVIAAHSSSTVLPTIDIGIPYHPLHHDPTTIPMYSRAGGNSSYVSFDMTAKGGGKAIHASNPQDTDIKQALKCTSKPKKTTQMELSQMGGDMYTRAGTSLPTIFIDGPYSSPSEHFFDYKVGVLIAAGIGVTPAASILRSIYFQWLQSRDSLQVKKVYLFWAYRDMHTLEWFKDLLIALSEEGLGAVVEIHTYFTGKVPDSCCPQPSPVGDSFGDMVVSTPIGTTSYVGRPDFDCIFEAVGALHPDTRIGTFFCGPKPMQRIVRRQAHKWNGRLKRETSTYIDFYSEKF